MFFHIRTYLGLLPLQTGGKYESTCDQCTQLLPERGEVAGMGCY